MSKRRKKIAAWQQKKRGHSHVEKQQYVNLDAREALYQCFDCCFSDYVRVVIGTLGALRCSQCGGKVDVLTLTRYP